MVDAAVVCPNGTETLLGNDVGTFFSNDKPIDINRLIKLRNNPFWLLVIGVVQYNKTPLFSKDLITFLYFISLFFTTSHAPVIHWSLFLSLFN